MLHVLSPPGFTENDMLRTCWLLGLVALLGCGDDKDTGATPDTSETDADTDADADTDTDTDADTDTDTDSDADADAGLEIVGSWVDDWATAHEITEETWIQTYQGATPMVFHVAAWDNAADRLVAQNDAANEYFPSLWSRFDWVLATPDLWVCIAAYDAADQSAAEAAPAPDATDPATGGCGGFAWSHLVPAGT